MTALYRDVAELPDEYTALVCHSCRHRHVGAELEELLCFDELSCLHCQVVGMYASNVATIEERFPAALSKWTPLPEALMDYREQLGLGPHELVTVWALERHRRLMGDEVWPSTDRLRDLTGLSDGQLKRATRRLVRLDLVARRRPRLKGGLLGASCYRLDALWQQVADLTTGHRRPVVNQTTGHQRTVDAVTERETTGIDPTTGHQQPVDHGSPVTLTTGHQQPTEVDVGEVDPVGIDPAGTDATTSSPRGAGSDDPSVDDPTGCRGSAPPEPISVDAPADDDNGSDEGEDREHPDARRMRRFYAWWEQHSRIESFGTAFTRFEQEEAITR